MKLFTDKQLAQLLRNGLRAAHVDGSQNCPLHLDDEIIADENNRCSLCATPLGYDSLAEPPVVKLFTPDGAATWLLTALSLDQTIAFGLCDLGVGFPELGFVSLRELQSVRGQLGLPIVLDRHFAPTKTFGEYAEEASRLGRISA